MQIVSTTLQSFITSCNFEWFIRSHITCHSKNVIYFLKCLACDDATTNSGKTNNLRNRTNVHISGCRTGRTTDIFDLHVFDCNSGHTEPFFKLFIFTELMDDSLLDAYERYVHKNGHDTMNEIAWFPPRSEVAPSVGNSPLSPISPLPENQK